MREFAQENSIAFCPKIYYYIIHLHDASIERNPYGKGTKS